MYEVSQNQTDVGERSKECLFLKSKFVHLLLRTNASKILCVKSFNKLNKSYRHKEKNIYPLNQVIQPGLTRLKMADILPDVYNV